MLCATTAKSNFIRAYVDSSYGKGFWFFKKN